MLIAVLQLRFSIYTVTHMCHLGRPFNDMFYCTTIISLIRSTKQTLYVMKIPFPLSCVPVSPSTSIHRWMPVLVSTLPVPSREEKPRVLWGPWDKDPCPWSCQGSQRRGESVFLLKFFRHQFHLTTGGRGEGRSQEKWEMTWSLVSGWFLPSQKYKEMKTHQSRMPFHASSSYLISSICFLLVS